MNFTDTSGRTVASFTKPTTANVWGCDGALGAPNDLVVGPDRPHPVRGAAPHHARHAGHPAERHGRRLLQGQPDQPLLAVIHAATWSTARRTAFAFDDVQNQESLVHYGDPRQAGIVMTPF